MRKALPRVLTAAGSGLVFGLGLSLSGMLDPVRVRGFLDVFGAWDPSLAFVLGGAVTVAMIGMAIMRRSTKPAFDRTFHLPGATRINRRLVIGSAIFGIGWGLGGLCPGPAVAALSLGTLQIPVFVAAMVLAMVIHDNMARRRS